MQADNTNIFEYHALLALLVRPEVQTKAYLSRLMAGAHFEPHPLPASLRNLLSMLIITRQTGVPVPRTCRAVC